MAIHDNFQDFLPLNRLHDIELPPRSVVAKELVTEWVVFGTRDI